MNSQITCGTTRLSLPTLIARDVEEFGEMADAWDTATIPEDDKEGSRRVPLISGFLIYQNNYEKIAMPESLKRAMFIYRGLKRLQSADDKEKASLKLLYNTGVAMLETSIKNGPSGPVGDDAPNNDNWISEWKADARATWNALFLRLVGQNMENEWEKSYAFFYLSGCAALTGTSIRKHYEIS